MGGAAITIALQQLRGFLGIKKFTKKTNIISVMRSVWGNVHHGVSKLGTFINMPPKNLNLLLILDVFAVELADYTHCSSILEFPSIRQVLGKPLSIHIMRFLCGC